MGSVVELNCHDPFYIDFIIEFKVMIGLTYFFNLLVELPV